MKKRLILAALLSVGVLVGCGNKNSSETPVSSETPSSEAVSSEEVSSENTSSESSSSSSSEETATVSGWGTLENPLTVAQVAEKLKDYPNDGYTTEMGYMTGVVKSIKDNREQYGNFDVELELPEGADYAGALFYWAKLDAGVSMPKVGDTVVGYGYFQKYHSSSSGDIKYELAFNNNTNPLVVKVIPGSGSSTPDTPDTPDTPTPSSWGTKQAPLTVSQAVSAMSSASSQASTPFEAGYVTGKVESLSYSTEYSNYTIYLNDGFQLYGATVETGVDVPSVGDTVVASGTFKRHYNTYELDRGCKVVSTTHNNYPISLSVVDGSGAANAQLATVTGLSENALSGSKQTFSVVPVTGQKIGSVSVGGTVLEAGQDGSYSFTVTSSNEVKVEIIGENEAAPVTEELTVIASQGTVNGKSISWTGTNFKVINNQDKSTSTIRTSDTDHHRVYANSQLVVELTSGTQIKEVTITCTSTGSYVENLSNGAKAAGYTVSSAGKLVTISGISGTSITFNVSAQTRINHVSITYVA